MSPRPALFATFALFAVACSSSAETPPATTEDASVDSTLDVATEAASDTADAADAYDPLQGCTRDPGAGDAGVFDAGGMDTAPADTNTDTGSADGAADAGDAGSSDSGDPTGGAEKFTMAMATAGFPSAGSSVDWVAAITTEYGVIRCVLDPAAAPISVANFIGLARGTRPYIDPKTGAWTTGHFYDGLKWHRVIPDFVIQGGDPLGNGTGGPGYDLPVENHVAEPLGTLAMAAGTAPSGSQFYIVVGKGPAADYNVFGKCTTDVAIAISMVPANASSGRPKTPVHMQKVEIAQCPKGGA